MAQLISVKLSRFDASPWGFRLQGGKDFGAPLLIQKVNGGSPAEKAGLQAGDAVIKVNEVELFNLRHKEAQDSIVRAGNNFELTVQRGGSTWKPHVTPVGPAQVPFSAGGNVQPVTKTSLAAKKPDAPHIGSSHNFAPKPFGGAQVNGIGDPTVKSIVNKQYNTPVGMYSEETIAETLSAQAEVLAGGVLGVNFKKNEKTYQPTNSEVLKMVQEIDSEPKTPEPEPSVGGIISSPPTTGLRHVSAPETKPAPTTPHEDPFKVLPPGQNICADCERLIVGVFVRIKDKNLHVECFKCATCGTSLKNVGYYNINNKLYCDIHAKLVARQNPPAPNLEPITVPPGGRAPAGAISAALGKVPPSNFGPTSNFAPAQPRAAAPAPTYAPAPAPAPARAPVQAPAPVSPGNLSPQPGTLGPLPFHAPRGGTTHVNAPRPVQAPSSFAGPKPFSTPSAPTTSPARPAPAGSKFVWPPSRDEEEVTSAPTASPLYIPPSSATSSPGTQTGQFAPKAPSSAVKSVPASIPVKSVPAPIPVKSVPVAAPAPAPIYAPPPEPAFTPILAPPPGVAPPSAPSKQTAPFPEPFSSYLAKQQLSMRSVSSPVPPEKQPTPQKIELPTFAEPLQLKEPNPIPTEESDESPLQNAAFHKKYSMCSQEVLAINKDKPGPRFETLSETLETQMLVTSLTPEPVQRPESPTPMQGSKTSSIQDLPSTAAEQPPQQLEEQVKTVATETTPAQEPEPIPLPVETVVSEPIIPEVPEPSEIVPENIQSVDVKSEQVSVHSETVNISEKSFVSQNIEQKVEFSEMTSSSQVTVEEKQAHSQLTSALTIASERPFSPLPSTGILSQSEIISSKSEQTVVSESSSQVISQSVSGFVPVSREQEQSASQFQQHTRQISQKSIASAETVQSLPSHMLDHEAAWQSPMLSALTTASERPFSPLPSATVPMAPFPTQSGALTTQAINPNPFPIQSPPQAANPAFPKPFVPAMVSALTIAPERPYSPLPSATVPTLPASVPSAPVSTQAPSKPVAPAPVPLPVSFQSLQARDEACPSPMLSALTVAPDRPYSPLPSATKSMISASQQSAPITTPAVLPSSGLVRPAPLASSQFPVQFQPAQPLAAPPFKPSAPAPKPSAGFKPMTPAQAPAPLPLPPSAGFKPMTPAQAPAPLPVPQTIPTLKPVIPAPLATSTQGQAPFDREGMCPSPMLSALTIASERPYSPLPSATKALGYAPVQMPARQTIAPVPAPVKFSPSGIRPPVTQQPLRDETQLPQFARPAQVSKATALASVPKLPQTKFPLPIKPEPVQPQTKSASSSSLPVIGGFRPIIAPNTSEGFKPIQTEKTPVMPPSAQFRPEQLPQPARPETPVQRVMTPTPRSRSATPHQLSTRTGLQKPAAIPYYQQEMGEYPGQIPRSATPTCPMLEPRPQTPKVQLTKPEVPYVPQKPSASFERQPMPYQPAPLPAQSQVPQAVPQQQSSYPFPNIPFPEGFKAESVGFKPVGHPVMTPVAPKSVSSAPIFKPSPQPASAGPTFKPSPLAAPQPASTAPIFKPSPLAAPQPASTAPVYKPSPLAAPQPASTVPAFKPSPLGASQPASTAPVFKPSPLAAPQPASIAPAFKQSPLVAPQPVSKPAQVPAVATQPSSFAKTPSVPSSSSIPNAGGGGGAPGGGQKGATIAGSTAPRRGKGVLTQQSAGGRIPLCAHCNSQIRGPFITALGKNWCPEHFVCVNAQCRRPLADIGFVEEKGELYCEYCFEKYLAPTCDKCSKKVKGDCLNAIGKHFHPECFLCAYCGKLFGNNPFFLEDGLPYCEADWNELFTTKCFACGFPIEAGDRWVEALNNNYHSQCFNCTNCKKNLEGQSFYAKGGRPFCKAHAR